MEVKDSSSPDESTVTLACCQQHDGSLVKKRWSVLQDFGTTAAIVAPIGDDGFSREQRVVKEIQ